MQGQRRGFTADGGRKLGVSPTVLLVSPSLEEAGLTVVGAPSVKARTLQNEPHPNFGKSLVILGKG